MDNKQLIILIPHYNSPDSLLESIKSIDEEMEVDLLIVDDGSEKTKRPNLKVLQESYKFGKVYLECLKTNLGIENALNHGLNFILQKKYAYIGRLDCGDLNKKNRFLKQISYLQKNKEIALLGTWANIVDENFKLLFVLKHPVLYNEIKKKMYLNSMFVHPSVIFRTSILNKIGLYPTNYKAAEDYAFFFKIIKNFTAENYPEALVDYVVDQNSISSQKRKLQVKSRIRIILKHFKFEFYPIYGLLRNSILYFIPRSWSNYMKKLMG